MTWEEEVGERIRRAIRSAGKTTQDVATETGIGPHIYKLTSGKHLPGAEHLRRLAEATGVSADYLLARSESGQAGKSELPSDPPLTAKERGWAAWMGSLPADVRRIVVRVGSALRDQPDAHVEGRKARRDRMSARDRIRSRSRPSEIRG